MGEELDARGAVWAAGLAVACVASIAPGFAFGRANVSISVEAGSTTAVTVGQACSPGPVASWNAAGGLGGWSKHGNVSIVNRQMVFNANDRPANGRAVSPDVRFDDAPIRIEVTADLAGQAPGVAFRLDLIDGAGSRTVATSGDISGPTTIAVEVAGRGSVGHLEILDRTEPTTGRDLIIEAVSVSVPRCAALSISQHPSVGSVTVVGATTVEYTAPGEGPATTRFVVARCLPGPTCTDTVVEVDIAGPPTTPPPQTTTTTPGSTSPPPDTTVTDTTPPTATTIVDSTVVGSTTSSVAPGGDVPSPPVDETVPRRAPQPGAPPVSTGDATVAGATGGAEPTGSSSTVPGSTPETTTPGGLVGGDPAAGPGADQSGGAGGAAEAAARAGSSGSGGAASDGAGQSGGAASDGAGRSGPEPGESEPGATGALPDGRSPIDGLGEGTAVGGLIAVLALAGATGGGPDKKDSPASVELDSPMIDFRGAAQDSGEVGDLDADDRFDRLSKHGPERLALVSPLLGRIGADGGYLRAVFRRFWLILPPIGFGLGLWAGYRATGLVPPPALLAMLGVLAIIDSVLGVSAFLGLLIVALPGDLGSWHDARLLLGVAAVCVVPALVASGLRPIRRPPAGDWRTPVSMGIDLIALPLFTSFVVTNMVAQFPALGGVPADQFAAAGRARWVGAVCALAMLGRMIAERVVATTRVQRLIEVEPAVLPDPHRLHGLVAIPVRLGLFLLVSTAFVPWCWELVAGALLFVAGPVLARPSIARALPDWSRIAPLVPSGLIAFAVVFQVDNRLGGWLAGRFDAPLDSLRAGFVMLALPGLLICVLKACSSSRPDPPDMTVQPG